MENLAPNHISDSLSKKKIAVIGLGYVGLPLAIAFAEQDFAVTGFDISTDRIRQLIKGTDKNAQTDNNTLLALLDKNLSLSSEETSLEGAGVFIITVPTPVNEANQPDIRLLKKASERVARYLSHGSLVVYESTVYPGITEEICLPILEKYSGLSAGNDFSLAYSPERINPGDKEHLLENIVKIVAGFDEKSLNLATALYTKIIRAGIHQAPSIKVAEAAKIIENTQRDINIAFVNELAMIFAKMDIDTQSVLDAASTKWNFMPFRPGLVGGHCIGVDPYYLAHKARQIGHHPEMILAGRKINDGMGRYVADEVLKKLLKTKPKEIAALKVLVAGLSFKENVSDIRNTKTADCVKQLEEFGVSVDVYDPLCSAEEASAFYGITLLPEPTALYDAIVVAVPHQEFLHRNWHNNLKDQGFIFDIKGQMPEGHSTYRL